MDKKTTRFFTLFSVLVKFMLPFECVDPAAILCISLCENLRSGEGWYFTPTLMCQVRWHGVEVCQSDGVHRQFIKQNKEKNPTKQRYVTLVMSLATYMRKKTKQLYVKKCLSYWLFVTFLPEIQCLSQAKKNFNSPTCLLSSTIVLL